MKLRAVDPRTIKVPDVRVTSYFDSETLAEFRATVKAMGVLEPPICIETPDGLVLVDGYNRVMGAISEGVKTMQVGVQQGTLADVMVLNLVTSFTKGRHKVSDLIRVVTALYGELQVSIEELVKKTGLSRDYLERLITVGQTGPDLVALLDEGRIGMGHAYLLARVEDPDLRARLIHQQLTYHFTVEALGDHIKNVYAMKEENEIQKPQAQASPPLLPHCHYCNQEIEVANLRSLAICPACDGLLYSLLHQPPAQPAGGAP